MAARGYAVAALSYRVAKEAPFPTAIRDVKFGIGWRRGHADDYGIDPEKVDIWGESAGGHLIGLAATKCDVAELEPQDERRRELGAAGAAELPNPSTCVQAAVGCFGIYDLNFEGPVKYPPQPPEDPTRLFLGCYAAQCTVEQTMWVSPVTHIDKSTQRYC